MKNIVKIYDKVPRSPLHNDARRRYTGLVVLARSLLVALSLLDGVRLHDMGARPFNAQADRLLKLLLCFARYRLVLIRPLTRVACAKRLFL